MPARYMIRAIVVAAAVAATTPAWGACLTADLAGNYQIYNSFTVFGDTEWSRCVFRVFNNGGIKPGGVCHASNGVEATFEGGQLVIDKTCTITGHFILETFGIPDKIFIDHATFDLARTMIVGVAHTELGSFFSFTALRR